MHMTHDAADLKTETRAMSVCALKSSNSLAQQAGACNIWQVDSTRIRHPAATHARQVLILGAEFTVRA